MSTDTHKGLAADVRKGLRKQAVQCNVPVSPALIDGCMIRVAELLTGDLMLGLRVFLARENLEAVERSVEYPATWWDAFKGRWFPGWVLLRWPVRHTRVTVRLERWAGYPQANVAWPDLGRARIYLDERRDEGDT